jgi:hypothetical protein
MVSSALKPISCLVQNTWAAEWEKKYREVQGRYRAPKESNRVGINGRTFHARIQSIAKHTGGLGKAIRGLSYDKREGKNRSRADELEVTGGRTTEEMMAILKAVDEAVTRKNGKLALDHEIELPLAMTPHARQTVAQRIAAWFEDQGCPAHWAIHSHNEYGDLQPHLHMTTTARPITIDDDDTTADAPTPRTVTTRGPSVINGPAAMQHWRREVVARAINEVAVEYGINLGTQWHGGRLEETGIDRPAQRRRPMVAIKRERAATVSDRGLAATNAAIAAGDYGTVIDARSAFVERENTMRAQREEAARIAASAVSMDADQVAAPKQRKAVERPFKLATTGQRRLILAMAQEAGVSLPADALNRLDGGDLIAAVKAARGADREALAKATAETEVANAGQAVLIQKLHEAEQRAREASSRAEQTAATTHDLQRALDESKAELATRDARIEQLQREREAALAVPAAMVEADISARVEIRVAEVLSAAAPSTSAEPDPQHPERIKAGQPRARLINRREIGLVDRISRRDEVVEHLDPTLADCVASWDSAWRACYGPAFADGVKTGAALRHDKLAAALTLARIEVVQERDRRRAAEDQLALGSITAAEPAGDLGAMARIRSTAHREALARHAEREAELMAIVTAPDTILGVTVKRAEDAEAAAAQLQAALTETEQRYHSALDDLKKTNTAVSVLRVEVFAWKQRWKYEAEPAIQAASYQDQTGKVWPKATEAAAAYDDAYREQWRQRVAAEAERDTWQSRWTKEAEPAIKMIRLLNEARNQGAARAAAASRPATKQDRGNER